MIRRRAGRSRSCRKQRKSEESYGSPLKFHYRSRSIWNGSVSCLNAAFGGSFSREETLRSGEHRKQKQKKSEDHWKHTFSFSLSGAGRCSRNQILDRELSKELGRRFDEYLRSVTESEIFNKSDTSLITLNQSELLSCTKHGNNSLQTPGNPELHKYLQGPSTLGL